MQQVSLLTIVLVIIYLAIVGYLAYKGSRGTRNTTDYLIAGREVHPFVMALSYGATFISTSAIVGFGGVAGMFGMSLLWLTFCNIFVGIFIAFVFLGGRTRRMGHHLDAHTFPELLGRRFNSTFIQVFSGLVIFLFIPLYAAAVLIGGVAFIEAQFHVPYEMALLVFSVIIALYVVMGGLKGVMYTDAFQGSIMFLGMLLLLIVTYVMAGGFIEAHENLAELGKQPNLFNGIGFKGWTSMPAFGFGVAEGTADPVNHYNLWWIIVSTITLGVGIGVLAQPQLVVRFMTVKSKRELNRAVLVGGVFILVMTGVAFTVGSLSNIYFLEKEVVKGTLVTVSPMAGVIAKRERGINPGGDNPDVKELPCKLLHIDTNGDQEADTHLIASAGEPILAKLAALSALGERTPEQEAGFKKLSGLTAILPKADVDPADYQVGETVVVKPRAPAYLRAIAKNSDGTYECKTSTIIPIFIGSAMPKWFGTIFLLTLLAAAMSTLSSQFHAVGTSIGRDVYEQLVPSAKIRGTAVTRIGIIVGILIAVLISYFNKGGGYIIARATAIFFGLCATTFLPAFIAGLFWRRVTKTAVISSMITGFVLTTFWLLFIKDQEARALGICKALTGKYSLLLDKPNWAVVDPIMVALPVSALVLVVVTLFTKPMPADHIDNCFKDVTR
ncbi:MAG: sodium:solute symporter family protein [Lentisphaeria bacterium]|nr:sodium:solute symporter family protein [Lentisphaeria bacterium]